MVLYITVSSTVVVMACRWRKIGIDPFPAARALWLQTRPLKT